MAPTFGAIPSPPDPRDYPVAMALAKVAPTLPLSYRLTSVSSMPPVYEQWQPDCVTASLSGMAEFHERVEIGGSVRLDHDRMYARCKELDGIPDEPGTFPRVGLDVWLNEGIWTPPGDETPARGGIHFGIEAYYSVPVTQQDVARVIWERKEPVAIAMTWAWSWLSAPSTGIMPPIDPAQIAGGHQVWAWGFDLSRPERGILCRNSWNDQWGVNGNFWMGEQIWSLLWVWECWYVKSRR